MLAQSLGRVVALAAPVTALATLDELVAAAGALSADGFWVTVVLAGQPAYDDLSAEAATAAALEVVEALHHGGAARRTEIELALSVLGQDIAEHGPKVGLEHAGRIARAARAAGVGLVLELGDHERTEAGLETLRELRKDFPEVGAGLSASLRRTEDDCRALAFEGSRVRLAKGSRPGPASAVFADRHETDKSYVRCLKVLLAGQGMPVVSTHDPRLVRIAGALATRFDRTRGGYEYQLRHGVRSDEQRRLADAGDRVRVRLAFRVPGDDAPGSLLRRLADRGSDLTFFLRSRLSRR